MEDQSNLMALKSKEIQALRPESLGYTLSNGDGEWVPSENDMWEMIPRTAKREDIVTLLWDMAAYIQSDVMLMHYNDALTFKELLIGYYMKTVHKKTYHEGQWKKTSEVKAL